MESWDDENFEPPSVAPSNIISNKWEGEDEDDDVKESWEDEDEDKDKEKEDKKLEDAKKSKKKSLADKIAEKERLQKEELERRLIEQQEEDISPEEQLRRQKESDLKLALETTFGGSGEDSTIDGLNLPSTKEEFQEFTDALSKKIVPLSKSPEYPLFIENLCRNLCATMSSLDIKKVKNTLDNLFLEKQKIEKGDKSKKSKGKGKAKLRMEDENHLSAYVNDDFDDYNDFM